MMCEREAAKLGRSLFYKYWQDQFWKNKYTQHIMAVNTLLKLYSPQAIENALKRKEGKWILSFRVKQFAALCNEEQCKIDAKKAKVEEGIKHEIPKFDDDVLVPVKPFGQKTGRSKLDE